MYHAIERWVYFQKKKTICVIDICVKSMEFYVMLFAFYVRTENILLNYCVCVHRSHNNKNTE